MNPSYFLPSLVLALCFNYTLSGQQERVTVEADSGILGSNYLAVEEGGVRFARIQSNFINATYPGSSARVITYTITFPDTGTYDLYARIRVGPSGPDDDSFFYGKGFGMKDTVNANDWVVINQLSTCGYTGVDQIITGDGEVTTGTWKWINISEFIRYGTQMTFRVDSGNLNLVFQIGGRENGIDIDKFVFAPYYYYYTVSNLDLGGSGTLEPPTTPTDSIGIPIAQGKCKFLGSVHSYTQKVNFRAYWNQVTPENSGKWGSVEGTRDVMGWADLDAAYALAKDNGYPFRMHVLIWGAQQPAWIETLSPEEQLEEIKEWFSLVASRYNSIDLLEVVNEPLHDPPNQPGNGGGNYIAALGGNGTTGWDWVIESFRLARQYFPNSQLMINDYNIVNSTTNTQNYIEIIELLQNEDLIDAIGVQGHAFSTYSTPAATITSNLNLLAATGLPIYVTELDIDGSTDEAQLQEYQRIFPVFWEHPSVNGITLWGYRPGLWRNSQKAYIVNSDRTERPSMTWLKEYVDTVSLTEKCYETQPPISGIPPVLIKEEYSLKIFPNPAINGSFIIQGIENMNRVKVFDIMGKQIQAIDILNQSVIEIELNTVPGIYVIQISDEQISLFRKIMIR
jgi:endo-1,4-beta-xylanase